MGIDIQGFSRDEGSDDLPPGFQQASAPSPPPSPPRAAPSPSSSNPRSRPSPAPSAPKPEPQDVEMSEEDAEEAKAKADALAAKAKGSEYYKQRQFEEAAAAFSQAWDLWPKDVTFLTNLGAVYFEQGDYDKCIETCEKAVEEGRGVSYVYFELYQGRRFLIPVHFVSSALTTNSSRRLLVVSGQPTHKKGTSPLPRNTSKSRSLSTVTPVSSQSSRPPKKLL
jgi:hypothetical protein